MTDAARIPLVARNGSVVAYATVDRDDLDCAEHMPFSAEASLSLGGAI